MKKIYACNDCAFETEDLKAVNAHLVAEQAHSICEKYVYASE